MVLYPKLGKVQVTTVGSGCCGWNCEGQPVAAGIVPARQTAIAVLAEPYRFTCYLL